MSSTVVCPICSNNETTRLFEKQGCTFVQCIHDNLVYINPQPGREELQEIYDTYGKEFYVLPESISASADYPEYRRRFLDFRQANRLLEIGAAAGAFLVNCRNDGWDTYGVELSVPSSQFAREQQGLDVITGTVHDAGYLSAFFDVVVAWQTLEHVPDPHEVVTEIFRILRPGGFFVLSVPCWNGLSIRLIKERHRYVGRDHLFYFSSQNIYKMLRDIGFSKVYTKTAGFNPIVCYQDVRGITKRLVEKHAEKGKVSEVMVVPFKTSKFLKFTYRIFSKIIGSLSLGDTLFVEAVK